MATVRQLSFAGGVLAPSLFARVDQIKYATGLRTLRNMYILRHGGVSNRPGFKFIAEVANSALATRIIPFRFNTSQTYILELSNLNLRVTRVGAPIRETAVVITAITAATPPVVTAASHGYTDGDDVYISGVVGMTEVNGRTFKVANKATNTFELTDLGGTSIVGAGYTAYTSDGTSEKVYEITTVFETANLFNLTYTQSKDVVTFAHNDYRPQELTRSGHAAWAIANKTMAPSIAKPTGLTVPAGGTYTWYQVTAINDDFEESLPSSAAQGGDIEPTPTSGESIRMTWTKHTGARQYAIYRRMNFIYSFVNFAGQNGDPEFTDIGLTPDTTDTPPKDRDPFSATSSDYPAAVGYFQQRLAFANTLNNPQTIYASRVGLFKNHTISTPVKEDDALTLHMDGRQVNGIRHILELRRPIIFTDTGHFTLDGDAGGVVTPFSVNIRQNGYNGSGNVPPLVVGNTALFIQSRGSVVRDLNYDFSTEGYQGKDLTVFSAHLFDGFSIVDWSYQETPHSVIWAVRSDGKLLSLTYIKEHELWGWALHDTDGLFKSVAVIPGTLEDDVYVVVERTINSRTVKYLEKMNSRLQSDVEDHTFMDSYATTDGTNTAATTMTLSGGTDWDEGELLTLTSSAAYFAATDVGDEIHLTGSDSSVIRFTIDNFSSTTIVTGRANETVPSVLQATATAVWGKAIKTVSGLWHLEGETVAIFADGYVVASPNNVQTAERSGYPTHTVSGGQVTITTAAVVIQVGLPYYSDMETLDIDTFDKPLIGKAKIINEVELSLEKTRGVWMGGSPPTSDTTDPLLDLAEMKIRGQEALGAPIGLFTGTKKLRLENRINTNGRVFPPAGGSFALNGFGNFAYGLNYFEVDMAEKKSFFESDNFNASLIAGGAGAQSLSEILSGLSESRAQRSMGALEQATAETNARLAEMFARDAIERGIEGQALIGKHVRGVIGKQRASFAGQGVKVGVGSAADVEESARAEARLDMEVIKNNAWREAWGYEFQAVQSRFAGQMAKQKSDASSKAALIAGGLKGLGALAGGTYALKGAFKTGYGYSGSATPPAVINKVVIHLGNLIP